MHRFLVKEMILFLSRLSFIVLSIATSVHAEPPSICSVHCRQK